MLNPKHQRYADRLRELIDEGQTVANLERPGYWSSYIQEQIPLQAWLAQTSNIIETVFGLESPQHKQYVQLTKRPTQYSYEVLSIVGLLTGALSDLEGGFLLRQEFLIAAEVFDSILEQAKHLNTTGYKDSAAVLARVVIEDALRRMAREDGLDDTQKAATINDRLKGLNKYSIPQWRQIQTWLDIGNAAAHGKFGEYTTEQVLATISGIEQFLATHFN